MAELIPTDEFLVNRNNTTYTQEQGTLMANLEATDKLLVNRSDKTYTITGQEFIDSVVDPLSITVTLAPTSAYVGTPVTATAVASGGKEPDGGYQFNYQWHLADDLAGTNASIIIGATNQSYEPVEADIDSYLGCVVSTTDLFGNTAIDTAYIGPIDSLNSAPVIDSVTLTETGDGSARFTSQTFAYDTVMTVNGNPAPQYSLKAKLSGSTFDFSTKSDTITNVDAVVLPGDWNAATAAAFNSWRSVTYGNGKFVAVSDGGSNQVMHSTDGINWTSASAAETNYWEAVTYGNGKFVAVASYSNRVMHSPDGITWTAASATEANAWRSVTYGGGKFVAVSSDGTNRVMHSPDGINWTSAAAPEFNSWNSVTYGNGKFVAIAATGTNRVMYSYNGTSWYTASATEANNWQSVTYGNGKFVAVSNNGLNRVMHSTSGSSWTAVSAEASNWHSVTYGDGKFVAVAVNGNNRVMHSTDGDTWTAASATEANNWNSVTYGNGKFVAVSQGGPNQVMWSTTGGDSYEATELTCASDADLADIDAVGGKVYMTDGSIEYDGSYVKSSYRPVTSKIAVGGATNLPGGWNAAAATEANNWSWVTYGNGRFVAVAGSGTNRVMYSDDGITWKNDNVTGVEANGWQSVTYGNGKFVAVASSGTNLALVMYSTDGITWTIADAAEIQSWVSVTYGNGKFVAVAVAGANQVMYSDDGINWKTDNVTGASGSPWRGVTYGDGKFVAIADSGANKVMYSTDGISWTGITAVVNSWQSVTYGNGKFVAVSDEGTNRVMYSNNGINWTGVPTPADNWMRVTYGNGTFVATSYTGGAMNSSDGISWTVSTTPEANNWRSVTYGGGKFVAVSTTGTNRVMWSYTGSDAAGGTKLAFEDPCVDLQYFRQGDFIEGVGTTGTISEVDPNGLTMTLTNTTGDWTTQVGRTLYGPRKTAEGTWDSYTGTDATVSSVNGRWIGANAAGTEFSIAPEGGLVSSVNEAYANLQIVNDKARVNSIQADDPGFLNVTAQDYTIEFPALFATGNEPDVDLPAGTSISAIVKAENEIGESIVESNTVMPSLATPEGAAGHITAATETELTVASSLNLDGFVANDRLVMVDDTGAVTSYTPESSAIDTAVDVPGGWNAVAAAEVSKWRSVTYANNKFVAIASSGTNTVMHSPDGINWTAAAAAEANTWYSVTYGNNKFVAVATTGTNRVMHSPNGITWTAASATEANDWFSVTYGNGKFVAVAFTGTNRVMHSPDGITWTAASATEANDWQSVTYGDNKFVAVAQTGTNRVMYSGDGITWKNDNVTGVEATSWQSVTYGDGKFVAISNGTNQVMHSPDGITWTAASATEANGWYSVTYGDGKFVAVASFGTNQVMWSTDGINWTAVAAPEANAWSSVIYGNDKFVSVAYNGTNRVMWSTTGTDGYTELTFEEPCVDLQYFEAGDFVEGPNTSGTVIEADPDGPTMSLSDTTGDWTAEVGSKVTGPEKSGVGNFVSTNGTDTITIQNSNNEWIGDNAKGEQFYAIKEFTALNANDPKHVEMSQAIADAFAAFPQNVNARRTSIASSFYRLMGGETLTAEETDLLTSTVLNAVNAVEPFALDGYYPLYYTAEAANAASSVGDHHTHDINGETFYMPDGGTIYHGNYVAPEETEETSGY